MKINMKTNTLLKNIITLCFIAIIPACNSSKQNELQEAIEKVILPQLDAPKSYEFASLQILDTITFKSNVKHDKLHIKQIIENNTNKINRTRKLHSSESKERLDFFLSDEISAVKIYSKALEKLDSIEKQLIPQINQTAAYICKYKFRSNNELGNLSLTTIYFEITPSPSYTILNIQTDAKKLSTTPGDYPGKDLVKSELKKYESPQDILNKFKNALSNN
ncbi:hypothetical protein ACT3CE_17600 [Marinifilum sp. RC60d5]|uniref:hypothetical protein n=1 Tax=Marinifilum sp. RC60d5 TaxID=3458414 RepID=UPI004036A19D